MNAIRFSEYYGNHTSEAEIKAEAQKIEEAIQPNYWIVLLLPVVIVSVIFFKKRAK